MNRNELKLLAERLYQKHESIDDDGNFQMDMDDFEAALTDVIEVLAAKKVSDMYPEIKGKVPVVLYFETKADADEFESVYRQVKPNVVTRKL